MDGQYEVLNPWADVDPIPLRGISPPLKDLMGKTIGLFINPKVAALPMQNAVEAKLKERFSTLKFSRYLLIGNDLEISETKDKAKFEEWVKGVDAVIGAVGDCGGCTKFLAGTMIHAENLNKPTVALCNQHFVIDARSAASSKGMPAIRIVPESVPCECSVVEQIEAEISAVMDDIVAALTQPLTAEEKSPKPKEVEKLPRVVFRGNLEEVNRFFYRRGWADGLPIIPPTEEAVEEMLTGTDLSPEHVVCKLIPRFGKATVEKIAINAVMAGALPTYMPVLIAAVQALMEPIAYFNVFEVSTIGPAPFWILNGPISKDINVNNSSGVLGPGEVANTTIGRAMELIIQNIGGARKGKEDMSVFGSPLKYNIVMAENEEESPWEPLHVEHGFNKEDSTVTFFCPDSLAPMYPYGTDDKGILEAVIYNVRPAAGGLFCLLLPPSHARTLAGKGWTKRDIKAYISEYARVPAYRHPVYHRVGVVVPEQQQPPTNPQDSMSILVTPDWIRVVVAGGPGNTICLCHAGREGGLDLNFVTKKVELPANWDKLVEKYKDIVPMYVDY